MISKSVKIGDLSGARSRKETGRSAAHRRLPQPIIGIPGLGKENLEPASSRTDSRKHVDDSADPHGLGI